jgi:hypothetical protein
MSVQHDGLCSSGRRDCVDDDFASRQIAGYAWHKIQLGLRDSDIILRLNMHETFVPH